MFYIPVLSLANTETVVMRPNSCIIREGYMKGFFQMKFNEQINYYIETFDCTAKELCDSSGFSPATLSRYRSGERTPDVSSAAFRDLCSAIAEIAASRGYDDMSPDTIYDSFCKCDDICVIDKDALCANFDMLISILNINVSRLCYHTNYDSSTIFRIRNGKRQPSDPVNFASDVAGYVAKELADASTLPIISELTGCTHDELNTTHEIGNVVKKWLLAKHNNNSKSIKDFLTKLNDFDLNEYINTIHFNDLKVPTVPFQLPGSRFCTGLNDMMNVELDFLKATVLSKSTEPVYMYSDMPMEEMAKDPEFPKKWMFGMCMMLKKGLHLNMIHNIDRSFNEMMLGLESYIPMYMTGQISPYYLKGTHNSVFMHFLRVSGQAAVSGEAIKGHQSDGRYYFTKNKEEVACYRKRAEQLLALANPLMEIYRSEQNNAFRAFMRSDSLTDGKRRCILSAPPVYTFTEDKLRKMLIAHNVPDNDADRIITHLAFEKDIISNILKHAQVEIDIPLLTREDFDKQPVFMPLSDMFYENDIPYTYEEYEEHIELTGQFARENKNFTYIQNASHTFSNLQISIHEGRWAMVSKGRSPAIHFVIRHPKMREAIENFVPVYVE